MTFLEGKYNIKAISQMTGVQPGTLRAWERRYKILSPVRNESGHRLYTEEDAEKLKWLMEKVEGGFTISQAVSLMKTDISFTGGKKEDVQTGSLEYIRSELLEALMSFEEKAAQEWINYAFSLYSVEKVLTHILGELISIVQDKRKKEEISGAYEYYAVTLLQTRINMLLYAVPAVGSLHRSLVFCGPGEDCEISLTAFNLFLRQKGHEVVSLGNSVSVKSLEEVIEEVNPEFTFMSFKNQGNEKDNLELVDSLKKKFPQLKIGLIGDFRNDADLTESENKYELLFMGEKRENWIEWLTKN